MNDDIKAEIDALITIRLLEFVIAHDLLKPISGPAVRYSDEPKVLDYDYVLKEGL